jgi:hypothetical protein
MRIRPLTLLLGLTLLTGCTTTSEGTPRPTLTNDTSAESPSRSDEPDGEELPYAGAPKVNDPLETSRYQQDPCLGLTAAQTEELNVNSPGEPRDGALGNACTWGGRDDRRALVELASLDEYPFGLSAAYQANEDGKYDFFEVLPPIEGYPAVALGRVDDRQNGGCALAVGVSDEIAFGVTIRLSTANVAEKDPCETAAMVAGMALRTMKAGS